MFLLPATMLLHLTFFALALHFLTAAVEAFTKLGTFCHIVSVFFFLFGGIVIVSSIPGLDSSDPDSGKMMLLIIEQY